MSGPYVDNPEDELVAPLLKRNEDSVNELNNLRKEWNKKRREESSAERNGYRLLINLKKHVRVTIAGVCGWSLASVGLYTLSIFIFVSGQCPHKGSFSLLIAVACSYVALKSSVLLCVFLAVIRRLKKALELLIAQRQKLPEDSNLSRPISDMIRKYGKKLAVEQFLMKQINTVLVSTRPHETLRSTDEFKEQLNEVNTLKEKLLAGKRNCMAHVNSIHEVYLQGNARFICELFLTDLIPLVLLLCAFGLSQKAGQEDGTLLVCKLGDAISWIVSIMLTIYILLSSIAFIAYKIAGKATPLTAPTVT